MKLYDTKDAAARIGISRGWIHRLISEKNMPTPARRVGQSYAWTATEIARAAKWYRAWRKDNPQGGRRQRKGRK